MINSSWPRPDGLSTVLLKTRRHGDPRSSHSWSQFECAYLHVSMRTSEDVDESGAKCRQASATQFAARNLWQTEVERPDAIEFTKDQAQCPELFLDRDDGGRRTLATAPKSGMVVVASGRTLAGMMSEVGPSIATVAKEDPTAALWAGANVRAPRRGA